MRFGVDELFLNVYHVLFNVSLSLHDLSTRFFVILIPIIHWTPNPLLARSGGSSTRLVCCDRPYASSFVAFSLRYFYWFCTLPWLSFWVISTFASNYIKWKLSKTGGINTCFDSHETLTMVSMIKGSPTVHLQLCTFNNLITSAF